MTILDQSAADLRLALLVSAGMTFIVLGLAAASFFRAAQPAPLRLRVHRLVASALAFVHLTVLALTPSPAAWRMTTALAMYVAGLSLFLWAQEASKRRPPAQVFSETPPDMLFVSGPFGVVRHPFYVAQTMVWWAGAVASGDAWLAGSALWMMVTYWIAAREEERAFARGPWAGAYNAYTARTPACVPTLRVMGEQADPSRSGDRVWLALSRPASHPPAGDPIDSLP